MRFIANETFAQKLDEPDKSLAESIELPLAYADRRNLRAAGFNEDSIAKIVAIRRGEEDFSQLEQVNGVGPKTARRIYETLGITTVDELEEAADRGSLVYVEGISASTQEHIRHSCSWYYEDLERMPWDEAHEIYEDVKEKIGDNYLKLKGVGSYRRGCATVGDVDMLAIKKPGPTTPIQRDFSKLCDYIIRLGDKKMTGRYRHTQVDIQIVTEEEWPAALQYFTGSQEHNVMLRSLAKKKGWKLNEYGLWDRETTERIPVATEKELYEKLLGHYVEPEEREE